MLYSSHRQWTRSVKSVETVPNFSQSNDPWKRQHLAVNVFITETHLTETKAIVF